MYDYLKEQVVDPYISYRFLKLIVKYFVFFKNKSYSSYLLLKSSVFSSIFLFSINSVLYCYHNSTITYFVPWRLGRDNF